MTPDLLEAGAETRSRAITRIAMQRRQSALRKTQMLSGRRAWPDIQRNIAGQCRYFDGAAQRGQPGQHRNIEK